jgi:hypothetical protein
MIFRKGVVHLLAVVLFVSLLGLAVSTGANRTFTPDKLKGWLAQSGIYDQVVPAILKSAETKSTTDGNQTSIPLTNEQIQKAAEQAFSSTLIQQSVNTFIDGNYAWLQGDTATPSFKIDLTKEKEEFAKSVGEQVQTRLASLPACSVAQLAALQIPVDPLTITCRPTTLDPKAEGTRIAAEISNSDFLDKPVLTADSLNQDSASSGKPYYSKLSSAPKAYQRSKQAPLLTGVLIIVCALAIIAIAPSRRRGLRRVGLMLLDAGLVLVAFKFVADGLTNTVQHKLLAQTLNGQLTQQYTAVIKDIETSLTHTYFMFGIVFVAIAAVILIALYVTRGGNRQSSRKSNAKPASDKPSTPQLDKMPDMDDQDEPGAPTPNKFNQPAAPARDMRDMGVTSAPPLPRTTRPAPTQTKPAAAGERTVPPIKRRPASSPRPPRLIQ